MMFWCVGRVSILSSFDQANRRRTKKCAGIVLVLVISRELVHLINEEIEVESRSGEGSPFNVGLPVSLSSHSKFLGASLPKSGAAESSDENSMIESSANINDKKRVLLAEDNPTTQKLISILLQQVALTWQLSIMVSWRLITLRMNRSI